MKFFTIIDDIVKGLGALIPSWAVSLVMRFSIFIVFWRSVQTKINGYDIFGQKLGFWNINDSTFMLFEYEYALPIIPYELATYLATFGEFFLSLGILFGLLTRVSAIGLLIMTLVIQLFVYPGTWPEHILWASILLYLIKDGAGNISLDYLIRRKL